MRLINFMMHTILSDTRKVRKTVQQGPRRFFLRISTLFHVKQTVWKIVKAVLVGGMTDRHTHTHTYENAENASPPCRMIHKKFQLQRTKSRKVMAVLLKVTLAFESTVWRGVLVISWPLGGVRENTENMQISSYFSWGKPRVLPDTFHRHTSTYHSCSSRTEPPDMENSEYITILPLWRLFLRLQLSISRC